MRLGLQAFTDSAESSMVGDWSPLASNVNVETNKHGFGTLSCFVRYSLNDAFRIYDMLPTGHLVLSAGGWRIFEGRIEDRRLVTGGIEVTAFGYWRAMYDAPYTALWTDTTYNPWRITTEDDESSRTPAKWILDNNNRLYFSLKHEETYANDDEVGGWFYELPNNGERDVTILSFDYDLVLPANWVVKIASYADGFTSKVAEATVVTGNGASQSGNHSEAITANKDIVEIYVFNLTGSSVGPVSGESDAWYCKITNIQVKTTSSTNIYADEIVNALASFISTLNSDQLSSSTSLIESPSVALTDEIYHDRLPAEIAEELANRGDDSSPPDLYEVGVWEGQRLHFREKGKYGMDWYTDIARLELDSTMDTLYNDAYSVYQNARGQTVRTATSADAESVAQYGITRRGSRSVSSTSATVATTFRDAFIADNKEITPRARVTMQGLFNSSGGRVPLWMMRAGDTLTIRNLPPGAGTAIDKIRKFRVRRTTYDVDNDILTPEPELEAPSLEFLVASNLSRLETFIR